MKHVKLWMPLLSIVMLGTMLAWARRPAAEPVAKEKAAKPARLVQPWSLLASLSEEQKSQIAEIHAKANADKKAIDQKEESDIMALLNAEQKAELEKVLAARKAAAAEKRKTAKEEGADKKKEE